MRQFSTSETYILYVLLIIITTYFTKLSVNGKSKCKQRFFMLLTILVPSIIAGLRYKVGTDYLTYCELFDFINNGLKTRMEIGFKLLNIILGYIGLKSQSVFFFSSLIMMIFVYKALYSYKDKLNISLGMSLFMTLYYFSSYNIVRIMIAISICFYNVKNIKEKRFWKYLIYNLIAISFHNTALIQLPMYFIYNYGIKKKNAITMVYIYLLVILVMLNFNNISNNLLPILGTGISEYYSSYIEMSGKTFIIAVKQLLIYLPIMVIGITIYKQCSKVDEFYYIYFTNFVIGVIILVLSTFLNEYVVRISDYFLIYSIILMQIYSIVLKINNRKRCEFVFIMYALLIFIYNYIICGNHQIFPYQWILK